MALTRPTLAQLTTGIARISDPITVLHQGATSANVDVGFLFNRANGLVSNVALYWSESAQSIVTAYTSSTGQIDSNVTVTSYAPLTVGNLLLVNGSIIGVVGNITLGNLIANTGVYATSFNFANGQPFTTSTYSNANVTAYIPTDSTITAIQANVTAANAAIVTANTAMKGYVDAVTTAWTSNAGSQQTQINTLQTQVYSNTNVAAYLPTYAGTVTGTFSGTASITSGSIAATTVVATNFSSGNAQITGGNSAWTTATAANFSSANIASSNGQFGTLTATNFSTGNAIISGGNAQGLTYLQASNFSTGNAVITGGSLNNTAVGASTASTGRFTTIVGTDSTDATSTTTGALQVTGGASVRGNVWIGGNLYVANIFSVTTNTLSVTDPLVYFQSPSPNPYNYDIGFYSDFVGGPVNIYGHTGVVRAQSSNTWVFFSNINSEPTSTGVNWSDAGVIYDAVKVGAITVANTTTSTSNVTGALVVSGGVGVAGNLNASNVVALSGFTMGSQVFYAQGTNGFSVNENFDPSNNSGQTAYHYASGATRANIAFTLARTGQFTDGFGVYGTSADNTFVTFGEQSNTSFEWRKGIGIQPLNLSGGTQLMKLSSAGNLVIPTATASASTTTGALVVSGGAGINGNVFAGNVYTGGLYWAGNGNVISTGGGITYTASTTAPSSPKVGDQWYNTTNDVLYEYQNVGTANFWIDIVSPILSSGTVTTPSGGDLSPFLLMGA